MQMSQHQAAGMNGKVGLSPQVPALNSRAFSPFSRAVAATMVVSVAAAVIPGQATPAIFRALTCPWYA